MKIFFACLALTLVGAIPSASALVKSATTQVRIGTALVCDKQTGCLEK